MSNQRHEKFQDSNALTQLSRQLQAQHAADIAASAEQGLVAAPHDRPFSEVTATKKRQKTKTESATRHVRRTQAFTETTASLTWAAEQVPVHDQPAVTADDSDLGVSTKQATAASGVNVGSQCHESGQVAARDNFVDWYTFVCTSVFANEFAALQNSQDSTHAQPSLILKCIKMHATNFGPQQQQIVMQQGVVHQERSNFGGVSPWL